MILNILLVLLILNIISKNTTGYGISFGGLLDSVFTLFLYGALIIFSLYIIYLTFSFYFRHFEWFFIPTTIFLLWALYFNIKRIKKEHFKSPFKS